MRNIDKKEKKRTKEWEDSEEDEDKEWERKEVNSEKLLKPTTKQNVFN